MSPFLLLFFSLYRQQTQPLILSLRSERVSECHVWNMQMKHRQPRVFFERCYGVLHGIGTAAEGTSHSSAWFKLQSVTFDATALWSRLSFLWPLRTATNCHSKMLHLPAELGETKSAPSRRSADNFGNAGAIRILGMPPPERRRRFDPCFLLLNSFTPMFCRIFDCSATRAPTKYVFSNLARLVYPRKTWHREKRQRRKEIWWQSRKSEAPR